VYWIEPGEQIYNNILSWSNSQVKEANGLKAVLYTPEIGKLFENVPCFEREAFVHTWEFDDPEIIYETVKQYCKVMWKTDKAADRINFEKNIDEFFPDGVYPDIKKRIISEWNKGQ
jgi:hypothetical protein